MSNDSVVVNGGSQTIPNVEFASLMRAVLARGASFRFQANGFSMSPFIHNGDIITIEPALPRLRFGEVVAFVHPDNNRLTVHRIIHVGQNGYLTKGDNSPEIDGLVSRSDIIGRVTRLKHGGKPSRFGLGVERVVIAFLSRHGWLIPSIGPFWSIIGPIVKRFKP